MIHAVVQSRGCVGNKGHTGAGEVEVIEPEAEAANAFIGVVVEAEVIRPALPTQLDIGVDHIAVVNRIGIHIHGHTRVDDQGSGDLLSETDAEGAEINGLVEVEGAGTLLERAAPSDL